MRRWRRACGRGRAGMECGHAFTLMLLVRLGVLMLVPADGVGGDLPSFLRRWSSVGTRAIPWLASSPLDPQTTVGHKHGVNRRDCLPTLHLPFKLLCTPRPGTDWRAGTCAGTGTARGSSDTAQALEYTVFERVAPCPAWCTQQRGRCGYDTAARTDPRDISRYGKPATALPRVTSSKTASSWLVSAGVQTVALAPRPRLAIIVSLL